MKATATFSPIVSPRPVTLPVSRINPYLVRLGELNQRPLHELSSMELQEWSACRQAIREDLDRKIELERQADLLHDIKTEARAFPVNKNPHDD